MVTGQEKAFVRQRLIPRYVVHAMFNLCIAHIWKDEKCTIVKCNALPGSSSALVDIKACEDVFLYIAMVDVLR